jgi:hypothetical protein
MRKWGVLISIFYALIVVCVLVPVGVLLVGTDLQDLPKLPQALIEVYKTWTTWIPVGAVLSGQVFLLFLSVDTSWQRLKPRRHVFVSCAVAGMLVALLTTAVVFSLKAGIQGDKLDRIGGRTITSAQVLGFVGLLWMWWGFVFFTYLRNSSATVARIVSWLLRGSVLELLVAVPCHVIVRRRDDCSAPMATSFGIVTGIAVMLLSFGPSVLLLYKKRLEGYERHAAAAE